MSSISLWYLNVVASSLITSVRSISAIRFYWFFISSWSSWNSAPAKFVPLVESSYVSLSFLYVNIGLSPSWPPILTCSSGLITPLTTRKRSKSTVLGSFTYFRVSSLAFLRARQWNWKPCLRSVLSSCQKWPKGDQRGLRVVVHFGLRCWSCPCEASSSLHKP